MRLCVQNSDFHSRVAGLPSLRNLKELTERVGLLYGKAEVIIEKEKETKIPHTAEELLQNVRSLGTALLDIGLRDTNIAILGENSYLWVVSFLAVTGGVGRAVPLDKEMTDSELCTLLCENDIAALIYTDTFDEVAESFLAKTDGIAICVNGVCKNERCFGLRELIVRGSVLRASGNAVYDSIEISPDEIACIAFTSGTTGCNKGVMLTHRNFTANIESIADWIPAKPVTISVLPMNHIYELNCNILPMLYVHTVICINDRMRNLMHNFRFFNPEMTVVVPLFLESFYEHIWAKFRKDGQDEKMERLVAFSNRLMENGIDMRRTLFKRVHDYFGGRLTTLICGGAPANPKYVKGLSDLGFDIFLGYGLTEASPIATINLHTREKPDCVGLPFPENSINIYAPDADGIGEIRIWGDNVTPGYYRDRDATCESFDAGWFKTGDFGMLDAYGELHIKGRKKNLIILDNGKNVHPEELEAMITESVPSVREAVVLEADKLIYGVHQKLIAAVVYVDPDDFPGISVAKITEKVKNDVSAVNAHLPGYKTVSDVMVVTHGFEKNSSQKILRDRVIEEYNHCQNENAKGDCGHD